MPALSETAPTLPGSFDEIAGIYDDTFTNSAIGRAQRRQVWKEADRTFVAGQRILEINCGTGADAIHLAGRGVHVTACDCSPQMIALARQRLAVSNTAAWIDFRILPIEQIGGLGNEGPFDGVFSNFAGLNCLPDLSGVARDLAQLIKTQGKAILCLFGPFCLWETLWYSARGNLRKAFRRFDQRVQLATLSPHSGVKVWYHSLRKLQKAFSPHFRLVRWKGVGVAVPPSYLESIAAEYPRLFHLASEIDPWAGSRPGLRAIADHMLLTFERTGR